MSPPGSPDPRVTAHPVSRRTVLRYGAGMAALAALDIDLPSWLAPAGLPSRRDTGVLDGSAGPVDLVIGETEIGIARRAGTAVTINGTVPGPLLRFREGDEAVLRVTNTLDEDTSIHWHGIILPNGMDGVPRVNFPGIRPGETFTYRYHVKQFGTYWYHSHSGLQEQLGHYAPLVIDPAGEEPEPFDREHVVILSDWTFEDPYRLLGKLKKHPDYYNVGKRTVFDFFRDVADDGLGDSVRDRMAWGRMRMMPSDISDITAATYTYLLNGLGPEANWTGLFEPGERVRIRFVNASAATFFDIRIPGLPMMVIQTDGQHVRPVETDEFRLAIAKTMDVIVQPREDRAYTLFAESMGRGGYARGTLSPREGMEAPVPDLRPRFELTMADMGMAGHGDMGHEGMDHEGMDHERMGPGAMDHGEQDAEASGLRPPGTIPEEGLHGPDEHGPASAGVAMMATSRLGDPGNGLGEDGWRVLSYMDLEAPEPWPDFRAPDREVELHLTGNMERYWWTIDGVEFSDAEPIRLEYGERIRLTMVNDTMMSHPMHLHGMWMYLENGKGDRVPRLHTIEVKPAEKVSLLVDADALGPWAFHCHVLYHMDAGMFRVVEVSATAGDTGGMDGATHR